MIIQIILVAFFIFAIFKVLGKFKNKEFQTSETIAWSVFWILAIVVVMNPNSTYVLAKFLGVGRGVDAVVYLSLAILFFLIFKMFVRLEKMERQITKVVRAQALKDKDQQK